MENLFIDKIEPFSKAESSTPCGRAAYFIDRITPVETGIFIPKTHDDKSIMEPKTAVYEDENQIIIEINTPGVPKNQLDVSIKDHMLTVSAQRSKPKNFKGNTCSVVYKATILIPTNAISEKITTEYNDGILFLTMPVDKKSHNIQVSK